MATDPLNWKRQRQTCFLFKSYILFKVKNQHRKKYARLQKDNLN